MIDVIDQIKDKLKNNSDAKYREVRCPRGTIYIIYLGNMVNTTYISEYIIAPLLNKQDRIFSIDNIKKDILYASNVGDVTTIDEAIKNILNGDALIVCDFIDGMMFCETKGYSKRSISPPETENNVKGPREAFVENIADNMTLIRRRINNSKLKSENFFLGSETGTNAMMFYIEGTAPDELVTWIRSKLNSMNEEFITNSNYVEEHLQLQKSSFDTIGYTERADVAAVRLLEGRVVILVAGTPFAIVAPTFFLDNFYAVDDYVVNRYFSTFVRFVRLLAFILSTLLPGFYIALITYHFSLIPSVLVFRLAVARAGVPFPTIIEVFLMFFFFQLLREAGIRMPQPIGSSLSIVGALILGDAAVGAGFASQITVIIVAISSISSFIIPKLYSGITLWAIIVLLFSATLGLPGFYMSFVLLTTHLASLSSCGYPFLFPLGTLKAFKSKDVIIRGNLKDISNNMFERGEEE